MIFKLTILAVIITIITGKTSANTANVSIPEMPLSLFRSSGMEKAYKNEQKYVDMLLEPYDTQDKRKGEKGERHVVSKSDSSQDKRKGERQVIGDPNIYQDKRNGEGHVVGDPYISQNMRKGEGHVVSKSDISQDKRKGERQVVGDPYISQNMRKGVGKKGDVSQILRSELLVIEYKQAGCQLYPQVYELPNNKPNVKQYPSCILINRCGGCPGHSLLACKPTTTIKRPVKVVQHIYDGRESKPAPKVAYIDVEEHTACEIRCKLEQTDCNSTIHNYDAFNCQCACKPDLVEQCPSNKRWDEDVCSCQCAVQTMHCGQGYYYNRERCRCEAEVQRSREIIAAAPPNPCAFWRCRRRYESVLAPNGQCSCEYRPRKG